MSRPNILFLMSDQHRADCMGCEGNSAIRTPHMDRLAREGVRFAKAYSSVPSCTPARAGILTGQSPWHHGMLGFHRVAERYPVELPRALREVGYFTYSIGKNHFHPQRNTHGYHGCLLDESGRAESPEFISDYRQWFHSVAPELDPGATGIGWNDHRAEPYALPTELHPTAWTADRAVDFLDSYNRPEPFLLKVSFARPHSPYDPPQRYWDLYREEDMPRPFAGAWANRHEDPGPGYRNDLWHGNLGLEKALRARRGYYGSVTFVDDSIGRVLDALERRGMLGNTLIVYFSDHGDMLCDHHLWRKTYAYEGSARVPMLVRWPESMGMEDRRGSVSHRLVELRDILPTFLDAADTAIPATVDGMSLLRLVRGEEKGWREILDLEHAACYDRRISWHGLTDGRWKYIYHAYDGRQQLFDLESDPGEERDLASEPAHEETVRMWRSRMVEHFAERGEPFLRDGDLAVRGETVIMLSPHYPAL